MAFATPTFGGNAIFGYAPVLISSMREGRYQITAYPGVAGRDALFHGMQGGVTFASGILHAPTEPDLALMEQVWRNYQRTGTSYILVDTTGWAWPNVVLMKYTPMEPTQPAMLYNVSRRYEAVFEHFS